jgi:hypothetical protein
MAFGTFAAGLLTEVVGIQWALGSFGFIVVVMTAVSYVYLPKLRNLP